MSEADIFEPDSEVAAEFTQLMSDPAAREAFTALKLQAAKSGAARRYDHVLAAVTETPWAVKPQMLALIVDLVALRVAGQKFSAEEIDARIGARRSPLAEQPSGVAVLSLHGVIMPKASMMTDMSGGVSIESFRQQFRQALAANDVSGIVIDVDSPGGVVDGTPEMADEIRAARGTKPIVAVANTEAASGAYWLASQADEVVATKSARVGSIGVYATHRDTSVQSEHEGVQTTLISAGKYKVDGNPHEPLSDDARAHLQSMVDEYYGMFLSAVAKGRRVSLDTVRSGFGQGRVLLASQALQQGMIDRIASTDEVVLQMLTTAKRATAAATSIPFTDVALHDAARDADTGAAALNENGADVAAMIDDSEQSYLASGKDSVEDADATASEEEDRTSTAAWKATLNALRHA